MTITNDELKQICESNARSIAATNEGVGELKNTVTAFLNRVEEGGLQVKLITEISDDQADELFDLQERLEDSDVRLSNLRGDALADRTEFRAQAEADRAVFKEEMQAARAEWQQSFNAQQEVLQRLLLEIRSTNGELKQLGDRVSGLEAS